MYGTTGRGSTDIESNIVEVAITIIAEVAMLALVAEVGLVVEVSLVL